MYQECLFISPDLAAYCPSIRYYIHQHHQEKCKQRACYQIGVERKTIIFSSNISVFVANHFPVVWASHVSVLYVLPVHQHVLPAQHPHLALTRHHMALEHFVTDSVHLRNRDTIDAVILEARHRF